MSTVADRILDTLVAAGARRVYGVPGDAINHVVDALARRDDLDFVHVRHEEAGVLAAAAEAKLTGTLGVCLGTAGPGAAHLLNGLADAQLDGAPVLALTGQVARAERFTGGHQEIDQAALLGAVVAYQATIDSPEQIPVVPAEACRVAISQRQPVHLAVTADVVGEDAPDLAVPAMPVAPVIVPPTEALDAAASLLDTHDDVTILMGRGARSARAELVRIAEQLQAPIVSSLKGKEVLPDDHPHLMGGLGLLGSRPGVSAMQSAGALLIVGTDFPYRDFYPDPPVPTVQIDLDAQRIGRRTPVHAGLVGDAGATLAELSKRLRDRPSSARLDALRAEKAAWMDDLGVAEHDDSLPLRPQRVARAVSDAAADDAVFCIDTGAVTVWAARNLHLRDGQRFTMSGQLGTMAYALPAAIGAGLAMPDRQIIALMGDGGFTMLLPDLLTAVDVGSSATFVVFDNAKLGLIQVEQEAEGLPETSTGLRNPDFAAVAEVFGAEGFTVERADQLAPALAAALASDRPSVVHVHVSGEELTVPPTFSPGEVVQFAKAKTKEFFGGNDGVSGIESLVSPLRGGPLKP